jgi:hypothetical protein
MHLVQDHGVPGEQFLAQLNEIAATIALAFQRRAKPETSLRR